MRAGPLLGDVSGRTPSRRRIERARDWMFLRRRVIRIHIACAISIETQVTSAWQELHLPAGWSEITLVAPKPLIVEFKRRRRTRAARKQLLRKTEQRIRLAGKSGAP